MSRTPCSRQTRNVKFKLLQLESKKNHIVFKRTLNHLAKMDKLLRSVASAFLSGAFECMLLTSHVRLLE